MNIASIFSEKTGFEKRLWLFSSKRYCILAKSSYQRARWFANFKPSCKCEKRGAYLMILELARSGSAIPAPKTKANCDHQIMLAYHIARLPCSLFLLQALPSFQRRTGSCIKTGHQSASSRVVLDGSQCANFLPDSFGSFDAAPDISLLWSSHDIELTAVSAFVPTLPCKYWRSL